MRILTISAALILAATLSACGGGKELKGKRQIVATGTSIGLSVGTDPTAGGISANIGYKKLEALINPNALVDANGGEVKLSAEYGSGEDRAEDARSIITWSEADVAADTQVSAAFGAGTATGAAAMMSACGLMNSVGSTPHDCVSIFKQ